MLVGVYLLAMLAFAGHGWLKHGGVVQPSSIAQPTTTVPMAPESPEVAIPTGVVQTTDTIKGKTAILMYHYIRNGVDPVKDKIGYQLSISPTELEQQLIMLNQLNYHSATMRQVADGSAPPDSIALTFDDGYQDFYTSALPLLKKYSWGATVYIITSKIGGAYMTWDEIRELQADGIEIGSHTIHHPDLSKISDAQQRTEIIDSKSQIEAQIHSPVYSFCYPSGKFNAESLSLVKLAGYTNATTTTFGLADAHSNEYALPRVRISPGLSLEKLKGIISY